jgi:hypothetical protein
LIQLAFAAFAYSRAVSSPEERERYISSVIEVLEANDSLKGSPAHIYALGQRAEGRLELSQQDGALTDAMEALSWIRRAVASTSLRAEANRPKFYATVFRIAVDANVYNGMFESALSILQEWEKVLPSYQTKITKEMRVVQEKSLRK